MVKLPQGVIKNIYNVRVGDNLIRLLQVDKIVGEHVEETKVKATKRNLS